MRFAADRRLLLHTSLIYWNMFLIYGGISYTGRLDRTEKTLAVYVTAWIVLTSVGILIQL